MIRLFFVDGFDTFVCLFNQVAPYGEGRLFPVPGAAFGAAKADDDFIKSRKGFGMDQV
jgi:hypothetical protein